MATTSRIDSAAKAESSERIHLCDNPRCLMAMRTIIDDAQCPAFVADSQGLYLIANQAFCELLGAPAPRVIGSSIADWFEPRIAEERMRLRQHVLRTGRAVHVTDMLRGRRFTGAVHPFEAGAHQDCIFALLQARPARPEEVAAGLYPLECFDLGPLSELTARELEVLQLIGQGLTQREIADRLSRTVKTIEAHRASLGRKLHAKKNVHLVQIASAAGMLDPAGSPRFATLAAN